MKKFKELNINEQHREKGRFKPTTPHNVPNVAAASPRTSSDSAEVRLKEAATGDTSNFETPVGNQFRQGDSPAARSMTEKPQKEPMKKYKEKVNEMLKPKMSALDKFRQASAERAKKHDNIEKEMQARHAAGKEDMSGSIDRLEKSLNKEEIIKTATGLINKGKYGTEYKGDIDPGRPKDSNDSNYLNTTRTKNLERGMDVHFGRAGKIKEETKMENTIEEGQNKQVEGGDPCWKNYQMVGKKMKNGKEVPNCVPVKESKDDDVGEMVKDKLKIIISRAQDMHDSIKDNAADMPEWVKSKVTLAQDYISTACDYSCGKEQLGEESELDESLDNDYKIKMKHAAKGRVHSPTGEHVGDVTKETGGWRYHGGHHSKWMGTEDEPHYKTGVEKTKEDAANKVAQIHHSSLKEEVEQIEEVKLTEGIEVKKEYDDKKEAEHGVYHNGKKIGYVVHHKPSGTHTAYHSPRDDDDYGQIDDFHSHHHAVNQIRHSAGVGIKEEVEELDEAPVVIKTNKPIGSRVTSIGPGGKETVIKSDPPFEGPYTKVKKTITDKSGAKHSPMSRAKDLARKALSKQSKALKPVVKEEKDDSRKAEIVKNVMKSAKKKKSESAGADKFEAEPVLSSDIQKQ